MTQFSSGKHTVVSHDPWPFVVHSIDDGDIRLRTNEGMAGYRKTYEPRVDFEHPLTNPANPILADFRRHLESIIWEHGFEYHQHHEADWWLWLLTAGDPSPERRAKLGFDYPHTDEHVRHARKVLTRLVNLGKD